MTSPGVRREHGFTLIELLVVILIMMILSAIAIPVFFEQREKAWEAQMQSGLKNAATAIETYGVETGGNFAALDEQDISVLAPQGFTKPDWAVTAPGYFRIESSVTGYCLEARHARLTASSAWRRSTYSSSNPRPLPVPDSCSELS